MSDPAVCSMIVEDGWTVSKKIWDSLQSAELAQDQRSRYLRNYMAEYNSEPSEWTHGTVYKEGDLVNRHVKDYRWFIRLWCWFRKKPLPTRIEKCRIIRRTR